MNKQEEMLTVKEWAERAGIQLQNYDGFVEIYKKLSGNPNNDFETSIIDRFRNAGDIVCTRRAFESGLISCTMTFPKKSQYKKMAEVIPNFVESDINLRIATISGAFKHRMYKSETEAKEKLQELLELLKLKADIRQENIKKNNIIKETEILDLEERSFSPEEWNRIRGEQAITVEQLEVKLSDEAIQSMELLLKEDSLDLSQIPLDTINTLRNTFVFYGKKRER